MRFTDNGCFFTVSVSPSELDLFADRWPCSGMRGARKGVSFQFDKRTGDLVDSNDDGRFDDGATLALSEDAQAYGRKRLESTSRA